MVLTSMQFIKANPQELHNPALSFFKEFLEQGGYHLPPYVASL